jgi:hypothetical protein
MTESRRLGTGETSWLPVFTGVEEVLITILHLKQQQDRFHFRGKTRKTCEAFKGP